MYIANTWDTQDRRQRYTWKRTGNTGRYQIDYIRFWNSIMNAKLTQELMLIEIITK